MNYKLFLRRHLNIYSHRLRLQTVSHLSALALVFAMFVGSLGLAWVLPSSPPGPPQVKSYHIITPSPPPLPVTSARNIFIENLDTGLVIYQKSADNEIYPASTTKIVTALVSLETYPLDKIITVTKSYPEGEHIGFKPGEKVSVEKLLYALLVQSGNDAAEILAENYVGGREAFIAAMNTKVYLLGLRHTHFQNPTGLDAAGHYSSASDLARLATLAMTNPLFAQMVSTQKITIDSHVLTNTNKLLGKTPGVVGVKTGFTGLAGQSLISQVDRDGHRLLFVVLGSNDRFSDTQKLIDWAYSLPE